MDEQVYAAYLTEADLDDSWTDAFTEEVGVPDVDRFRPGSRFRRDAAIRIVKPLHGVLRSAQGGCDRLRHRRCLGEMD